MEQVSWISGKIPELGWITAGLMYVGYKPKPIILGISIIIGFFTITLVGFIIHRLGLFNADRKTDANLDPVKLEIYKAAKKINSGELCERCKSNRK